jgi:hypothetical protein
MPKSTYDNAPGQLVQQVLLQLQASQAREKPYIGRNRTDIVVSQAEVRQFRQNTNLKKKAVNPIEAINDALTP